MPNYPDITENYLRFRIRNPNLFKPDSFRTLDIGRVGVHKLIHGRLKSNNKWKVQSVIVEKEYASQPEVKKETQRIITDARRQNGI